MVSRKPKILMFAGLILVLMLSACASGASIGTVTPVVGATGSSALGTSAATSGIPTVQTTVQSSPSAVTTAVMGATAAVTGTAAVPSTGQSALVGARIVPNTARAQAVVLSNVMNYNVVDKNGKAIGTVSDYILNMCEAHIIYMVVNADPSLNLQNGTMVVIPYEVLTVGQGAIEVNQHTLVLPVTAAQVQSAPAVSQKPDLTTTTWESTVRNYWTNIVHLSALTTQCHVAARTASSLTATPGSSMLSGTPAATQNAGMVSATPTATYSVAATIANGGAVTGTGAVGGINSGNTVTVTKIAYASNVLKMQVEDDLHNPIGQVQEVYLVPESGRISYLAIDLTSAQQGAAGTIYGYSARIAARRGSGYTIAHAASRQPADRRCADWLGEPDAGPEWARPGAGAAGAVASAAERPDREYLAGCFATELGLADHYLLEPLRPHDGANGRNPGVEHAVPIDEWDGNANAVIDRD